MVQNEITGKTAGGGGGGRRRNLSFIFQTAESSSATFGESNVVL